jgi:hypothetical protein
VAVKTGSPIGVEVTTGSPTGTGSDMVVPVNTFTGSEVTVFELIRLLGFVLRPLNVSVVVVVVVVSYVLVTVISVCWVLIFSNSWVEIPSAVPALLEVPTSHGPVVGVLSEVLPRLVTMGGPAIVLVSVVVSLVVVVVTQVLIPAATREIKISQNWEPRRIRRRYVGQMGREDPCGRVYPRRGGDSSHSWKDG